MGFALVPLDGKHNNITTKVSRKPNSMFRWANQPIIVEAPRSTTLVMIQGRNPYTPGRFGNMGFALVPLDGKHNNITTNPVPPQGATCDAATE
jgi:hypothetical protein